MSGNGFLLLARPLDGILGQLAFFLTGDHRKDFNGSPATLTNSVGNISMLDLSALGSFRPKSQWFDS